jgi:hypothetical protein
MPDPTPQTVAPIANLADLELRVGDIDADDQPNALSLLRYASNLVRAYGNRRWDGTVDHPVPEELVEVVVGMVERATRNVDGVTQESAGPFTRSFGPAAAQRTFLTYGDKMIVRSAAGSGAFTVDQTAGQQPGWLGGGVSDGW